MVMKPLLRHGCTTGSRPLISYYRCHMKMPYIDMNIDIVIWIMNTNTAPLTIG